MTLRFFTNCRSFLSTEQPLPTLSHSHQFAHAVALVDAKYVQNDLSRAKAQSVAYSLGYAATRPPSVFPIQLIFPFTETSVSLHLLVHVNGKVVLIDLMDEVLWDDDANVHALLAAIYVGMRVIAKNPQMTSIWTPLPFPPRVTVDILVRPPPPSSIFKASVFKAKDPSSGVAFIYKFFHVLTKREISPNTVSFLNSISSILGPDYLPGWSVTPCITKAEFEPSLITVKYQFVEGSSTTPKRVCQFRSLFDTLARLHQSDMVHCDVRLANIVFCADGVTAKLIDFDFIRYNGMHYPDKFNMTLTERHPDLAAATASAVVPVCHPLHDMHSLAYVMKHVTPMKEESRAKWEDLVESVRSTRVWKDLLGGDEEVLEKEEGGLQKLL